MEALLKDTQLRFTQMGLPGRNPTIAGVTLPRTQNDFIVIKNNPISVKQNSIADIDTETPIKLLLWEAGDSKEGLEYIVYREEIAYFHKRVVNSKGEIKSINGAKKVPNPIKIKRLGANDPEFKYSVKSTTSRGLVPFLILDGDHKGNIKALAPNRTVFSHPNREKRTIREITSEKANSVDEIMQKRNILNRNIYFCDTNFDTVLQKNKAEVFLVIMRTNKEAVAMNVKTGEFKTMSINKKVIPLVRLKDNTSSTNEYAYYLT